MNVSEKLKELLVQHNDRKWRALAQLPVFEPVAFLMELALVFEEKFASEEHLGRVQVGVMALDRLLEEVFGEAEFNKGTKTLEEIQLQLRQVLKKVEQDGTNKNIQQLFSLYESEIRLQELIQIHKYDKNCTVTYYQEGRIKTVLKNPEGLRHYIKDGLKFEQLTDFYAKKGVLMSEDSVVRGKVHLPEDQDEQLIFLEAVAQSLAASDYLDHYGVEEILKLENRLYKKSHLVEALSFLISYVQLKYGSILGEQDPKEDVIISIARTMRENIAQAEGETPGPLFISTWKELVHRMHDVFLAQLSLQEVEQVLSVFAIRLDRPIKELNIFEKPLLRLGPIIVLFARPLMLQNGWMPILNTLFRGTHKREQQKRVDLATEKLAEKFRKHGFQVWSDEKLVTNGGIKTDIDLVVFKKDHLFLLQLKMTTPRATQKEADSHIREALKKAGKQAREAYEFLEENWPVIQHKWDISQKWQDLKVIPLVVSTSFEADRQEFSGYLKISKFELERYLENDAFLFHHNPLDFPPDDNWTNPYLFYPADAQVSGAELLNLIEEDRLWLFLEPMVFAKDTTDYLPSMWLPDSNALRAQRYFEKGTEYYDSANYQAAATAYQKAIELFDGEEMYHIGLGNALANQGFKWQSIEAISKAIGINPYSGEAYNARGLSYHELGQYGNALSDLREAVLYSPYDISAWMHLAQLQVGYGQKWSAREMVLEGLGQARKGLLVFHWLSNDRKDRHRVEAGILWKILKELE